MVAFLYLCVIALVFYVWYLSEKVSKIDKYIKSLKNQSIVETKSEQTEAEKEQLAKEEKPQIADKSAQQPVVSSGSAKPAVESASPRSDKPSISWEQFAGIKLFAWIGGFAAFLGIIFFTKYAIDNNMISPLIRVCAGFVAGVALLCTGVLTKSERLKTTANVLSAVGIVFIYVSAYAAGSYFHMFNRGFAFGIMVIASACAFWVSVKKDAKYISVLAAICGYLTPILLSTGSGEIIKLSVYMAVLTVTMLLISARKKWGFLVWLASIGVYAILFMLYEKGFTVLRPRSMAFTYSSFCVLFTAYAAFIIKKYNFKERVFTSLPFLFNFCSLIFVFTFFDVHRSILALCLLMIINACQLMIAVNDKYFRDGYALVSFASLFVLLLWSVFNLKQWNLSFAVGAYFLYFLFNSALPFMHSEKEKTKPLFWDGLFAALLLFVFMVCVIKVHYVTFPVWIIAMLAVFFTLIFSERTKNLFPGFFGAFGMFAVILLWVVSTNQYVFDITAFSVVIVVFAAGSFALALLLKNRSKALAGAFIFAEDGNVHTDLAGRQYAYPVFNLFLLSFYAILIAAAIKIQPAFPDIFTAAGLLIAVFMIFLATANKSKRMSGVFFSLIGVFLMQLLWQVFYFRPEYLKIAVYWYFAVFAFFFAFIFLVTFYLESDSEHYPKSIIPWLTSALAGVLQCSLIYLAARRMPGFSGWLGIIPAAFALIYVCSARGIGKMTGRRGAEFGIFAAAALFFITMIFPAQFEKGWLTISWALEAAILIGLSEAVGYKPLKYWGLGISAIVFLRLVIPNANMFEVHSGSIINWYLYMYMAAVAALFAGASLWSPKDETLKDISPRRMLFSFAIILLFILLNIEIAAFFAAGNYMRFSFSNNFAQDMAYTLCWGVFAMALFAFGVAKSVKGLRIAGLILLSAATLKLFLHDLWNLGQLYRIGSFFGLAAMLILVSFLYQKYVLRQNK